MKSKEDIESFLLKADQPHQEVGEGLWVVRALGEAHQIVIKLAPPIVVFRVHVMDLPGGGREELYRTLLELNASDMVHGAYGVEDGKIVIVGALELENLDYNEFQAMLDDVALAVAGHHPRLARFRGAAAA